MATIRKSSEGLGLPYYDYLENTYDNNLLIKTTYKIGGPEGTVVGEVVMTYDGSGNLLTLHKTIG